MAELIVGMVVLFLFCIATTLLCIFVMFVWAMISIGVYWFGIDAYLVIFMVCETLLSIPVFIVWLKIRKHIFPEASNNEEIYQGLA